MSFPLSAPQSTAFGTALTSEALRTYWVRIVYYWSVLMEVRISEHGPGLKNTGLVSHLPSWSGGWAAFPWCLSHLLYVRTSWQLNTTYHCIASYPSNPCCIPEREPSNYGALRNLRPCCTDNDIFLFEFLLPTYCKSLWTKGLLSAPNVNVNVYLLSLNEAIITIDKRVFILFVFLWAHCYHSPSIASWDVYN